MASLEGTQSLIYLVLLISGILSFSWNQPENTLTWHMVQYGFILILTAFWGYVSLQLIRKTPQQRGQEKAKLDEAISLDNGKSGVTQLWYQEISNALTCLLVSLCTFLATTMLHGVINAYPNSPEYNLWHTANSVWAIVVNKFNHKTLFMLIWVFDVGTYWAVGLAYSYLDFMRPSLLMPFKVYRVIQIYPYYVLTCPMNMCCTLCSLLVCIVYHIQIQEDFVVNKQEWLKAARVSIQNQLIALVLLWFLWDIYPLVSPQAFEPELPSLGATIVQLVCFVPMSEIYFYFGHVAFHKNQWLYDNVHWFHHTWKSPIAISTLYVKPLEHILINLPSLIIGPFIMGSHITVWYVYIVGSIMKRELAHCGYHFPFFYPADIHDYHHSSGTDNFGVIGVLDEFFQTNSQWKKAWQSVLGKRYFNCEYPMDKIIAQNTSTNK